MAVRYLLMAGHVPPSGAGGGIVRYTTELAGALARRSDVELHLLLAGPVPMLEQLVPGAQVHRQPELNTAMRSVWERWAPTFGAGMDVVHGVKHIVPARRPGTARVLTVHDMLLLDRPADFPVAKRMLLRRPYLDSIRSADLVVCVSAATRARLLDYVPAVADRTVVVPLATPTSLESSAAEPVGRLDGRRFALVVGDNNPRKNLRLAVDTWHRVRRIVPDAVLAVAGPPDWVAAQRGGRWEEQLADGSVTHLGHVTDGALRWAYENASTVLCPSKFEGFGLPVVEAARFGVPLVHSDDPALGECAGPGAVAVAAHDESGWVAAVAAALVAGRQPVPVMRDWNDVADETVKAAVGVAGAFRR